VLVDKAPEGSVLMIGNSLSVRLVDIYTHASSRELDVLSQRGASGIDGLVAGTAGAATSAARPAALLIGDVSFLYDLSSLALAAQVRTPLVVFVVNNGGGRIFEQLPIVDVPGIEPEIVEHATTPHDTDFASAAKQYGVRYALPTSLAEVGVALDEAYAHAGCTLIEVKVASSGAIALARSVAAAIEAAVAPLVNGPRP
jgi:2-succinyl-5-enolpyruvyl-6-hydroxy-3-cyclohexene-1-carboxylate synthase